MTSTLQVARILRDAGFSSIPVKPDKRPSIEWRKFMHEQPTETDLGKWFAGQSGIALVAGKVQCLDFDEKYAAGVFQRFCARSEEVGLDHLIAELLRQKTPSGGFHLVWRCDGRTIRNMKLASRPATEAEASTGAREFSMIETRGDGGYFLIAPSKGYTLEAGDWSAIPTISEEDRDALLSLARSFDERPPAEAGAAHAAPAPAPLGDAELTPGDDFDARADIPALLRQHGWKSAGSSGKYWTRPGKARGISASWNVVPNRLWVFSSSTPFDPNHVYRPWHVYAVLECGGDYSRAAAELRRQGFGGTAKKKKRDIPWDMVPDAEPTPRSEEPGKGDPPGVEYYEEPPGVEYCPDGGGVDPHGSAPTQETEDDRIRRLLRAREYNDNDEPPPLVPLFSLADHVICTPGNLASITAQAKVGKSSFVCAMMAAAMTKPETETDLLSLRAFNVEDKAFIYFDTEQSPYHFWHAVNRAKRRAKEKTKPDWLSAFRVADLPAEAARKAIAIQMADAAERFGGIYAVVIDGVADLVADVNDAEECNGLVAELHSLSIRYNCAIVCVIHKNPGSEKVRGHLGSQIERKAETNLSLDKEDGVTVVWSAKQRGASIDKKDAPRFCWNDDLKMHVTAQVDENRPAARVVELLELAESVLSPTDTMTWKDFVAALQDARTRPDRTPSSHTVEKWITAMKKHEIVTVQMGHYRLNPKHQLRDQPPTTN